MSDTSKTISYLATALLVAGWAFGSAYFENPVGVAPSEELGQPLFPDFKDSSAARVLEIVNANEELGTRSDLKVSLVDGLWVLPTHGNYPADAANKIRDAATELVGLTVVGVASDLIREHGMYGVVEPSEANVEKAEEGLGTLVVLQGPNGQSLVKMIVGKKDQRDETQRFVRVQGRDRVYVVKFDLEKLPTHFEDWINRDLLNLNPLNVESLTIKDYTATQKNDLRSGRVVVAYDRRFDLTVRYENSKWELDEFVQYKNGKPVADKLLDTEELNQEAFNALKSALDEMQIIDVDRKPEGLGADLRADASFLKNAAGMESLIEKGFSPVSRPGQKDVEILAANGDAIVGLNDGVEYVLRFGGVATDANGGGGGGALNRYVLITARVSPKILAPPQLEVLPPLPAEEKKSADDAAQSDDAQNNSADSDDVEGTDVEGTDVENNDAEGQRSAAELERERIEKENQRKQDDYDEKLQTAQEHVRQLNERFADWYYVVSEDTFKKIHLGRSDVLKEKESVSQEGFGVDAFRSLEEGGIKPPPPAPAAPAPGGFPGGFPGGQPPFGRP